MYEYYHKTIDTANRYVDIIIVSISIRHFILDYILPPPSLHQKRIFGHGAAGFVVQICHTRGLLEVSLIYKCCCQQKAVHPCSQLPIWSENK